MIHRVIWLLTLLFSMSSPVLGDSAELDRFPLAPGIVALPKMMINGYRMMRNFPGRFFTSAPTSGLNNATRLSANELATGQRLERKLGKPLLESPHVGAEYVDDLGKTFDALGTPNESRFWNERQFLNSIDNHLLKANNFTVIDLTGFTQSQINVVNRHLSQLAPDQSSKIIKIGF